MQRFLVRLIFIALAVTIWALAASWAAGFALAQTTAATTGAPAAPGAVIPQKVMPAQEWSFDPPHDSIVFFVKHIFVQIPGRFDKFSGTVRFDPNNLDGSGFDVNVDMASVNTEVAKRDEDLRSPNFFDAAKFPTMRFVSQKIVHKGGGKYVAQGEMTIKDVTKRIELPFTYLGSKPSPLGQGKQVAGFVARFTLNMLDYHVSDGKFQQMGALGATVDIIINMELLR